MLLALELDRSSWRAGMPAREYVSLAYPHPAIERSKRIYDHVDSQVPVLPRIVQCQHERVARLVGTLHFDAISALYSGFEFRDHIFKGSSSKFGASLSYTATPSSVQGLERARVITL